MMPKPSRRTAGWITASILATMAVLVLADSGSARAPAPVSILPAGAIAPTDAQKATARKVGRILEEHGGRIELSDAADKIPGQRGAWMRLRFAAEGAGSTEPEAAQKSQTSQTPQLATGTGG